MPGDPGDRVFPAIADYGLIGNCHAAALVSSGSIDWLCLPRFDSPSLFARILDLDRGGSWQVAPDGQFEATHQYRADTNVLETTFTSRQGRVRLIDCMDVVGNQQDKARIAPGMLIRVVEGIDGTVHVVSRCAPRPDYARTLPRFAIDHQTVTFDSFKLTGPQPWEADEADHTVNCRVTVRPGERFVWTLATSDDSMVSHVDPLAALQATTVFWQAWVKQGTYQGPYEDAVKRSALVLRLLTDAPSGAIVAAPTTSLPETIGGQRNWDYRYTWLRDASFTLYALLLAGYHDMDQPFFDWIVDTVKLKRTGLPSLYPITPDGQVIEQTLDHLGGYRDSRPVRIGNAAAGQLQLDVYGEVLDALYFAACTAGFDPAPVWKHVRPLVDWVAGHWRQPENGIWEVRGGLRHFVYGKVMVWVALDRAIKLVDEHQLPGDVGRWRAEREAIRADVWQNGWSDRLQAWKQSYEDDRLDASNLLLPVVGFVAGTDPRMLSTVDQTLKTLVSDGLCYRYHDAPDGVGGSEGTFVLCTFWLIDALILANRLDAAQTLLEQMLRRASPLGLFAEEIDPRGGEQLGNFPQAFSHIGVINAAVSLAHAGQLGRVEADDAAAASKAGTGGGGSQRRPV